MTDKKYARMVARLEAAVPDKAVVRQMLSEYERGQSDSIKYVERGIAEALRIYRESVARLVS